MASQECDEGFSLSGSGTRSCGENGTSTVGEWTGEPAACEGKLKTTNEFKHRVQLISSFSHHVSLFGST